MNKRLIRIKTYLLGIPLAGILISLLIAALCTFFANIVGENNLSFSATWKVSYFVTLILLVIAYTIVNAVKDKRCKKLSKQWNLPSDMIYFGLYELKIISFDGLYGKKIEEWSAEKFLDEFSDFTSLLRISLNAKYRGILRKKNA